MSKLAQFEISKGIKAARFSFFPSINSSRSFSLFFKFTLSSKCISQTVS